MKTDREKEQLARNVEKLGSVVLDSLDREVGKTYDNQRRLEGEAKELEAKVVAFSKDIKRWMTLYGSFNDALKELGDVKNWAQGIETDLNSISDTLGRVIDKQSSSSSRETKTPERD